MNLQTITAMPAYEAKSPEELRLEDYMAGNKGRMGQQKSKRSRPSNSRTNRVGPGPRSPPRQQQPPPRPPPLIH